MVLMVSRTMSLVWSSQASLPLLLGSAPQAIALHLPPSLLCSHRARHSMPQPCSFLSGIYGHLSYLNPSPLWLSFGYCCHQEHLPSLISNVRLQHSMQSLMPTPHEVRQYSSLQHQGQSVSLPLELWLAFLLCEFRLQGPAVSQSCSWDTALRIPVKAAGPAEQSPRTIKNSPW